MKKFWEKHNLFKVAAIMVIITTLLTWIIPKGTFQDGALVAEEITRIGVFDFFQYGLISMKYFAELFTFLFILGGFYQVLSRISGYQKLTSSIAKSFKEKEIIFVLMVSLIIASLTAISTEYLVVLVFVPFFITILSKMKLDNITAFATTFGSILIGVFGSIYNSKISGINADSQFFGVEYTTDIWAKIALFAIAFIVFNVYNIIHIKKTLKDKKAEPAEDLFVNENNDKKAKSWPMAVIFGLFTLVIILAYLPWSKAFDISLFADATESIINYELFGAPVFRYILGNFSAFGEWDIYGVQIIMIIVALIIKLAYKIKMEDFLSAFGDGFKKAAKWVLLLSTVYVILVITFESPVLPVMADWILGLSKQFNVLLGTITGLLSGLFAVEYVYSVYLVGTHMANVYSNLADQMAVLFQSTYGLISMVAPSSAVLLIGLSYSNISYKAWLKYIWQYIIIMLLVIIVTMLIIC